MPQKIIDIIPPREVKPKEEKIEKIIPPKKEERVEFKKPRSKIFPISLISSFVIIIVVGTLFYFFSLGAKIIIWPKQELLNSQVQISIDKGANDINIFAKIIPGNLLKEEKTISQEFSATSKVLKEVKAEGIIRVYNNYSTAPQVLIVGTRLISSNGKLFKSIERVVVPGGKYEKNKLQPGYLDVKVRADQPGEEYNIEPSTFSIPGFAGTAKYTGFYGKSSTPMKGGFKGEVAQLTEKDIEDAKNTLSQRLFEETHNSLKSKISADFILMEETIRDKIISTNIPLTDASQETVKVEVSGVSEVLVFKKSDLDNFAKETILFQKPTDKKLNQESLKIDYTIEKTDLDKGKMILNLNISAKIFNEINEEELKKGITDKSANQIREFLIIQPQIEKTEIKLIPFWTKKSPEDINKVRIELRLD